jgi:hypothetical protein
VEVRCHLCQATNPPGAGWCNQCGVRFQPVAVGQPAGPSFAGRGRRHPSWPASGPGSGPGSSMRCWSAWSWGVVGGLLGLPDNVGLLLTLVAMIGYETLMLRW